MIWLAWRQFRAQAVVAGVVLAATTVALVVTGLHLQQLRTTSGLTTCLSGGCQLATNKFLTLANASIGNHLPLLFGTALVVVPVVIGIFWGAPLVARELEAGTYRLAFGQTVSRTRWLAVKLGLVAVAGAMTAGLISALVTWSASPVDQASRDRLAPAIFSERGFAPAAYTLFALALGVAAGLIIRRTVPAMAVTLAVFTAVQFAMRPLRQYLLPPLHAIGPIALGTIGGANVTVHPGGTGALTLTGVSSVPGWVYSVQTINSAGHVVSSIPLPATGPLSVQSCTPGRNGPAPSCIAALSHGYRQLISYQPPSRFWEFQWCEAGVFVALALALAGFSFWWIRRHLA
jgi:hypothetical protein